MADKFFITTPIYYINDQAHIGHAYTNIASDVLARYHRQKGETVLLSTGTDENAKKTVVAAEAAGKDIQAYTDEMAAAWQQTWNELGIGYDRFIRTTEDTHKDAVYALFEKINQAGDIFKGSYRGLYCVGCEDFKREEELVDGKCPEHQKPPEMIEEENYFFRLSKYQQPLLDYIAAHPEFVQPESRRNEVLAFISRGLEDISITRQHQKWGIPFPFDQNHVIYVWAEALVNYLTVAGYPKSGYEQWWPADIHMVGKGIIKFHCIIWPAMLMSAGLALPKTVLAHGHINIEGTKISKSLGNAISPLELARLHGNDALRYILLRDTPFGQDGEFSLKRFEEVYNSDLANDLGNLVQRVAKMITAYQQGAIGTMPKPSHDSQRFDQAMAEFRFDKALDEIWLTVKSLNQYVEEEKPWEIAKTGETEHLSEVLAYLAGSLLQVARLLTPFMPETAAKIEKIFAQGAVDQTVGILFPRADK